MTTLNFLPAILVGGPPHSGKSILSYSLSQALRSRKCEHYLMHAAPDGEGDWSQEAQQARVSQLRFKGDWSLDWIRIVCRDIARRTVPLLIDVGGKPFGEQFAIFNQCTATILLTPTETDAQLWRGYAHTHGLTLLADLHSDLAGENILLANEPVLRGTLAGLQRHTAAGANGPAFEALVAQVADYFAFAGHALTLRNLANAPSDAVLVNLDEIAQRLNPAPPHRFGETAQDIAAILAQIDTDVPLALYGRIPCWLAAILGARRNVRYQFDVRLGWIRTPEFAMAQPNIAVLQEPIGFELAEAPAGELQLVMHPSDYYLDYEQLQGLRVPFVGNVPRLSFNGRLPLWGFAALGRAYQHIANIWAIQPQAKQA